jgi:transcriptional regulator with XRE-family HTH domain
LQSYVGVGWYAQRLMKPSERTRRIIESMFGLGISQKKIAVKIGVSESTFSRWWNHENDSKGNPAKIPIEAMDRLYDFVGEFEPLLTLVKETPRETPSTAVPEGKRFRKR